MSLSRGERLGPYEIVDPIGAGGMGEVYRARDTRLDRAVAIKVLPEHLWKDTQARQRLEREARAVSSLNHPNICALYDIGQRDSLYYLVLEHLEGQTLAARLGRGPLPVEEALRYADQIADALHQAHRQGVIHRDLKPGNVMLTKSGSKLLDFGLSRSVETNGAASGLTAMPTVSSPLTAEGTVVGTLQYMSPEQLDGKLADVRSDVFAFGVLLYEMVTGRRAFEGNTQAGIIASILKDQPRSISELAPMTPPALERLVRTCLAKDPDDRRQSMRDVQLDLRWITKADTSGERVAGRPTRSAPGPWLMAAMMMLVAVVLGVMLVTRSDGGAEGSPVIRALIPPPQDTFFEFGTENPGPVAVSPDGRRMAFAARDDDGIVRLWIRELADLEARPVPGTEGGGYPFWSPDGRSLGFFAQKKLKRVDLDVGRTLELCDAPIGKGGTWSRDGLILFAPGFNTPIHRISHTGGESVPVTKKSEESSSHRFPQFLPDGRHFLYLNVPSAFNHEPEIMIGTLEGDQRRITEADTAAQLTAGHLLYMIDETLVAQPFDTDKRELTGDPFRIVDVVDRSPGASLGIFSASPGGVLVYEPGARDRTVELLWVNRKGERIASLGQLTAQPDSMALSPEGSQIAVSVPDASGRGEIWLIDPTNGRRSRFTFGISAFSPIWSADGDTIIFAGLREGSFEIYRKSRHGADVLPMDNVPRGVPMSWSSDGEFLAMMVEGEETGADIWIAPVLGNGDAYPFLESHSLEVNPSFSPDGRWLTYASNETGAFEVYVSSFEQPSRRWQVSTDGGQSPQWRGDGREIFYSIPGERLVATRIDLDGSAPELGATEPLFGLKVQSESIWQLYAVSPDGQRFLLVEPTSEARPGETSLVLVSDWTAGTAAATER